MYPGFPDQGGNAGTENGRESGVKEVLMRSFLHAGSLSLHTQATGEQANQQCSIKSCGQHI